MENETKRKRGRPEGAISKLSREAREKAALTGMLPHEFLLAVTRGEVIMRREVDEDGVVKEVREEYDFETRVDAAKAAAPYFAPKISTVEVIHGVTDEQLDGIIERAAAEAGFSVGALGEGEEGETAPEPASRQRRVIIE